MEIKSVTLTHTNPSMGPHEKKTRFSLLNSANHKEAFAKLANETTVNSKASLADYIAASKNKDQKN